MLVLVFLICSHYRVLEMRESTLPLCTIIQCSNNSAMFLARENNKSKNIFPVNVIYSNDENSKYILCNTMYSLFSCTCIIHLHENKECMVLHNTLLHNIIILIIFNIA